MPESRKRWHGSGEDRVDPEALLFVIGVSCIPWVLVGIIYLVRMVKDE